MLRQRKGIRVRGQALPHPARMRTTCVTAGTTTEQIASRAPPNRTRRSLDSRRIFLSRAELPWELQIFVTEHVLGARAIRFTYSKRLPEGSAINEFAKRHI
jgi:hypothetical protein